MTFEEWFHKEYESAVLQITRCAERKEGLHIPATVYLEDLKKAFEAGQKDLEKENAELKNRNSELAGQKASLERWLGEAKNLLNEFVNWANWQGNSKCPSFKSIQDKAEAFLEEE